MNKPTLMLLEANLHNPIGKLDGQSVVWSVRHQFKKVREVTLAFSNCSLVTKSLPFSSP